MDEKKEEKIIAKTSKGNIIWTVIILGLIVFIFLTNYKNENPSISSNPKRSIEDLKHRLNEIIEFENNHEFEKIYDDYYSPETKARIKRDFYIDSAKKTLEKHVSYSKILINDAQVNGDIGYVDRTRTECLNDDCTKKTDSRSYKKFVYVDNNWRMIVEEDPTVCIRSAGYEMPEEFKRAISLIIQRYDQSNNASIRPNGDSVKNIQNCLNIQYAKPADNISDAEGMFVFTPSQSMEKFDILVSPKYSAKDDLLTAILLSHEIMHVFDFIESQSSGKKVDCFETEAEAFSAQNFFVGTLNKEEINSISSRVLAGASAEARQVVYAILAIPKQKGKDYHEKALNFVKASPAYQKQCKDR